MEKSLLVNEEGIDHTFGLGFEEAYIEIVTLVIFKLIVGKKQVIRIMGNINRYCQVMKVAMNVFCKLKEIKRTNERPCIDPFQFTQPQLPSLSRATSRGHVFA